jgi:cytochrome c oxidase subunit 3
MQYQYQAHPYHLVTPSPWPLYTSFALFSFMLSSVLYLQGYNNYMVLALLGVLGSMIFWWRDVISEGTYLGDHTFAVQKGLNIGFGLFIVTEALFFGAVFWAFFHSSLAPTAEIGYLWPPIGIEPINPFELPLLNTVILLSSGATITYSHHAYISGDRKSSIVGLTLTLILAILFSSLQVIEYWNSSFTISDGIFGSCFFFSTGLHALHIIVGTLFLSVGLWRIYSYQMTDHHHLGLETSILYWHFVDVVWLILYIFIYYWGS